MLNILWDARYKNEKRYFKVPRTEESDGDANKRTSNSRPVKSLLSWGRGQGEHGIALRFMQYIKICLFDPLIWDKEKSLSDLYKTTVNESL